jgi:Zn-dependent protease/predicted transcriptional regulator
MANALRPRGTALLRQGRGIPLFSVLGIRVVADYSWFLIVALIATTLTIGWFPTTLPDRSPLQYVLLGVLTALFFFASVLVHELSHSVVAVLSGIPVRRITLFLFGGIAQISREPSDPGTELRVALAGPLMSAVLAAGFWIAFVAMGENSSRPGLQLALLYLALANSFLLGFNLLPGLPLDGGRVLRAIIWKATGNLSRATFVASTVGKIIAGILVIAGIVGVLTRAFVLPGLWFVFIALFLKQAADRSYRQVLVNEALAGVLVTSVMVRDPVSVPPDITLSELIESYLLRHHYTAYPVVDGDVPLGVVSVRLVKQVPRSAWGSTRVAEAMHPLTDEIALAPGDTLPTAMHKMATSRLGKLPVIEDGRLMGVVTKRDVASYLEIRTDLSV